MLLTGSSMLLALLFHWAQGRIVPVLVDYIKNQLWVKARGWFQRSRLAFEGMSIKACAVSLTFAYVFYVLLKTLFRFPGYWEYPVLAILSSAVVFSIIGYFVCGPRIKLKSFFKYFYIPAGGGIGVLVANFISENLVNFLGAVMHLLYAV